MTSPALEQRVCDTISHELGVPRPDVTRERHLVEDLGADSLDFIELMMKLEEEFEVDIPDQTAGELKTVGQIVDHIEREKSK